MKCTQIFGVNYFWWGYYSRSVDSFFYEYCYWKFSESKLEFIMRTGVFILYQDSHFKNFNEGVELLCMRRSWNDKRVHFKSEIKFIFISCESNFRIVAIAGPGETLPRPARPGCDSKYVHLRIWHQSFASTGRSWLFLYQTCDEKVGLVYHFRTGLCLTLMFIATLFSDWVLVSC